MKKNYQTNTLRMIWEMFYEEKMKIREISLFLDTTPEIIEDILATAFVYQGSIARIEKTRTYKC